MSSNPPVVVGIISASPLGCRNGFTSGIGLSTPVPFTRTPIAHTAAPWTRLLLAAVPHFFPMTQSSRTRVSLLAFVMLGLAAAATWRAARL